MSSSTQKIRWLHAALGVCALTIFAASMALNAMREYDIVRPVEFCIVPLCAAYALSRLKECGRDGTLVLAALFCTICADVFMILLEDFYPLSLAFFSAAQLIYCARIHIFRNSTKYSAILLPVRAVCSAAICAAGAVLFPDDAALVCLAGFYFLNLLFNAGEALALAPRGKRYILFAAGLILFAGCDICVGLNAGYTVGLYIGSAGLYAVNLLIWIFYMPSQILLAMSATKKEDRANCGRINTDCRRADCGGKEYDERG